MLGGGLVDCLDGGVLISHRCSLASLVMVLKYASIKGIGNGRHFDIQTYLQSFCGRRKHIGKAIPMSDSECVGDSFNGTQVELYIG